MNIPAIVETTALPPPAKTRRIGGAEFAQRLAALQSVGRKADVKDPNLVRQTASQLVSQLFFAPLLAEMRKLPFGQQFGNGGRMEDAFGQQLDALMAESVSAAQHGGLTEHLVRKLQSGARATAGRAAQETPAPDAPTKRGE